MIWQMIGDGMTDDWWWYGRWLVMAWQMIGDVCQMIGDGMVDDWWWYGKWLSYLWTDACQAVASDMDPKVQGN